MRLYSYFCTLNQPELASFTVRLSECETGQTLRSHHQIFHPPSHQHRRAIAHFHGDWIPFNGPFLVFPSVLTIQMFFFPQMCTMLH